MGEVLLLLCADNEKMHKAQNAYEMFTMEAVLFCATALLLSPHECVCCSSQDITICHRVRIRMAHSLSIPELCLGAFTAQSKNEQCFL